MAQSLAARAIERVGADAFLASFTPAQRARLRWQWPVWARPEQLPPVGDWRTWVVLAGRGFGKTRCGAEWVRAQAEADCQARIALVAPTAADARDVMVEGESGLLAISPPWNRPVYEPSKRRLTWSNGAQATTYSADEPDRLRGPQHTHAWCDELAAWRYPDAWDMLQFGLRLGTDPRCVVTTTPRPTKLVRELILQPSTVQTRGSTYDNRANLAPAFLEQIVKRFEGTRIGRQELHAEILSDVPGALWKRDIIDALRVRVRPDLQRIVVAVDPSGGAEEENDEQGIIVDALGVDDHLYTLADRSCRLSPAGWGRRAVEAALEFGADCIVYERNFGGDMVKSVLETALHHMGVTVRLVKVTASHGSGKIARLEPVAALYEQSRAHHVGVFEKLEDQLCDCTTSGYVGEGSPDRADAHAWAAHELMFGEPEAGHDDDLPRARRRI